MMRFAAVLLALLAASFLFWQDLQNDFTASASDVIVKQALPMDVNYEKNEASIYLNEIRRSMGMSTLSINEKLDRAAQAHAN